MGKKGWKNKRIWCVVIAAALLCVGTGGYLFFSVQAQGILTGLEEKVSQKVKDSKKVSDHRSCTGCLRKEKSVI